MNDCCGGICTGSHKDEIQGMIKANNGKCWVMDCPMPVTVKRNSGVEFCYEHSDRLIGE